MIAALLTRFEASYSRTLAAGSCGAEPVDCFGARTLGRGGLPRLRFDPSVHDPCRLWIDKTLRSCFVLYFGDSGQTRQMSRQDEISRDGRLSSSSRLAPAVPATYLA